MVFKAIKSVFVGAFLVIPVASYSAELPPIDVIKKNFAALGLAEISSWKAETKENGNIYSTDISRGFAIYSRSGLHAILAIRNENSQLDGIVALSNCTNLLKAVINEVSDSAYEEIVGITRDATDTKYEVSDTIMGYRYYTRFIPLGKNATMFCGVEVD